MEDNWEVEQKYTLSNETDVLAGLAGLGFVEHKVEEHCDLYFRHPCRDFRATDEAFRLRRVNENAVVTYKGKRLDADVKTRPEIELTLQRNEFDQWKQMLQHLGFTPLPEVFKTRRVFKGGANDSLEGFCVVLDTVRELGIFAEIELLVTEHSQLKTAQQRIEQLATQLHLDNIQHLSYLALLLSKMNIE